MAMSSGESSTGGIPFANRLPLELRTQIIESCLSADEWDLTRLSGKAYTQAIRRMRKNWLNVNLVCHDFRDIASHFRAPHMSVDSLAALVISLRDQPEKWSKCQTLHIRDPVSSKGCELLMTASGWLSDADMIHGLPETERASRQLWGRSLLPSLRYVGTFQGRLPAEEEHCMYTVQGACSRPMFLSSSYAPVVPDQAVDREAIEAAWRILAGVATMTGGAPLDELRVESIGLFYMTSAFSFDCTSPPKKFVCQGDTPVASPVTHIYMRGTTNTVANARLGNLMLRGEGMGCKVDGVKLCFQSFARSLIAAHPSGLPSGTVIDLTDAASRLLDRLGIPGSEGRKYREDRRREWILLEDEVQDTILSGGWHGKVRFVPAELPAEQ